MSLQYLNRTFAPAVRFPICIEGTGIYRPQRELASREIDLRLGWPAGETERRFGIVSRAVAGPEETSSLMAAAAARRALDAAGIEPDQVDLILGACGVGEQPIPATATLVHAHLGLQKTGIAAFDMGATCLSFVAALDHAALKIASGRAERVLIVSADIASTGLDWSHPEAAAIFGDGAAAVVVGPAPEADGAGCLALEFETWSEGRDACVLAAGGTRINPARPEGIASRDAMFRMDGHAAFRVTGRRLPRFLKRLLAAAAVEREQIDVVIPHQASAQALTHACEILGFAADQVIDIFATHGNQIAASLPTALHHAITGGRLRRGDTALLLGSSAGISLGGAVLRF